jgi:hypothetical protein
MPKATEGSMTAKKNSDQFPAPDTRFITRALQVLSLEDTSCLESMTPPRCVKQTYHNGEANATRGQGTVQHLIAELFLL